MIIVTLELVSNVYFCYSDRPHEHVFSQVEPLNCPNYAINVGYLSSSSLVVMQTLQATTKLWDPR